jgi:hypothetical protein
MVMRWEGEVVVAVWERGVVCLRLCSLWCCREIGRACVGCGGLGVVAVVDAAVGAQGPSSDDSTVPLEDGIGSDSHIAVGRVKVQLLRRRLLRLWLVRRASIARLFNAPRSRVLLTF